MRLLGKGEKLQRGHVNQSVRALEQVGRRLVALERPKLWTPGAQLRAFAINGTGADLRMGDCARVSGATTLTINQMLESGQAGILELAGFGTSVDPDDPPLVVACNAIKDGEAGEVFIAGICPARCEGSGAFAGAPASGAVLLRAASGVVRVLQQGAETVAAGGERWCLVLLSGAPAAEGGGGGGTAYLPAYTYYLENNDTGIYSGEAVLLSFTCITPGQYLVAANVVIETGSISYWDAHLDVDGVKIAGGIRQAPPQYNDQLNMPMLEIELEEDETVYLRANAYGGSTLGALGCEFWNSEGYSSPTGPTYLTIVGPLEMAVT